VIEAALAHKDREAEARISGALTFDDHEVFRDLLDSLLAAERKWLVLELSDLQAIDSGGIGMFLIADDEAKKQGARLKIRGAKGLVRRILELSGIDTLILVEHDDA